MGGWGFVVAVVVVTVVLAVEGKGGKISSASFDFAFSVLRFLGVVAIMKKSGI